ncbi:MAG: hypothetical protein LBQ19_06065, partial [Synergistaceae bacterium]|jgi:hypothetical protein|nr:hypothetical protein [Synergistaceae bacterium]
VRSDSLPRLGIFNTNTKKKKYVHFSWAEGAERSLKIKVGRSVKEYSMSSIIEGLKSLITKGEEALSLKSLEWRGVQLLGDLLHTTKAARSEADLGLIADNKRETLWYAYTPKSGKWYIKPCFSVTEAEKAALDKHLTEGGPWPALPIEEGRLPGTMRNDRVAKEIFNLTPQRWSEFLLPISKGLLFGFSDWSMGGEHTFGEALWKHLPNDDYRSEECLNAMASAGRQFMSKMIAYLRLWPILERVQAEMTPDSAKTAEARELKKRERFEMIAANLGDKRFKVTRYVDDSGVVAFGIIPETRLPGENDKFVVLSAEDWESSLDACSLGGDKDPQYTCNSVLGGIEVKDWYARIKQCVV